MALWATLDQVLIHLGLTTDTADGRVQSALDVADAWAKGKRPDLATQEATYPPPYTSGRWQYEPVHAAPPSTGCVRTSAEPATVDQAVDVFIHRTDWDAVYRDFTGLAAGIYLSVVGGAGAGFTGYVTGVSTAAEYVTAHTSVSDVGTALAPGATVTLSSTGAVAPPWACPDNVSHGVVIYAGLLFRERSTPQGIAGYEDMNGGYTDQTAYYRALDLIGSRKPVAR